MKNKNKHHNKCSAALSKAVPKVQLTAHAVHGTADKTLVKEVTSLHVNYVKDAT